LIYGDVTADSADAAAISPSAYQSLAVHAPLSVITGKFGAPTSPAELKNLLGVSSLAQLVQSQPAGESCAYYLDASNRTGQAFQLCFGRGYVLAGKAILATSPRSVGGAQGNTATTPGAATPAP
jgi:hypothetical protein